MIDFLLFSRNYDELNVYVNRESHINQRRHTTVLTLTFIVTSVIGYVDPDDERREANDTFKRLFPHVKISLSKYKSLKREMRQVCLGQCHLDPAILAHAFAYFGRFRSY